MNNGCRGLQICKKSLSFFSGLLNEHSVDVGFSLSLNFGKGNGMLCLELRISDSPTGDYSLTMST